MKAKLTSKGQITIPAAIRRRLRLEAGQVLEFDTTVPYLKATKVIDEAKMRSVKGLLGKTIKEPVEDLLNRLRGEVDLP